MFNVCEKKEMQKRSGSETWERHHLEHLELNGKNNIKLDNKEIELEDVYWINLAHNSSK
jgi:hypothetical protein